MLERLHDELLIPLIDRTFRLMLALDMLPPCPPELSGRHLKVEFVSLLAQAQKLVGISATDQYLALTLKAASAWPEALDSVDVDNLLDNYAQSLGLPANLTRPREERARLRAGREEARQTEQQLELLQKAADLGHTLADSDLTVEGEKSPSCRYWPTWPPGPPLPCGRSRRAARRRPRKEDTLHDDRLFPAGDPAPRFSGTAALAGRTVPGRGRPHDLGGRARPAALAVAGRALLHRRLSGPGDPGRTDLLGGGPPPCGRVRAPPFCRRPIPPTCPDFF